MTKLSQKYYRHRANMRDLINSKDPSIEIETYYSGTNVASHSIYGKWSIRMSKWSIRMFHKQESDICCDNLECLNMDIYKQSTLPSDDWESTMESYEVDFIWDEINKVIYKGQDDNEEYDCVDSYRGARLWKRSQRKRFRRLKTCCGSFETIVKRFNIKKLRYDHYLIGFNYGH
jgi:hypothetical protein